MTLFGAQRALFVSDMHLGAHDPATSAWFLQALEDVCTSPQIRPSHLFVLGDLFEAWVGDDDPDKAAKALEQLLARLSAQGISVSLMSGNRDFLLGHPVPGCQPWPARSGAHLLSEPLVIDFFGVPTVLCHGDSLCTDDHAYQQFRSMVRSESWQTEFLARPLAERQAIAASIRNQSEQVKTEKPSAWMDATEKAVRELFLASGARQMIHGHTHKPGRHLHELGQATSQSEGGNPAAPFKAGEPATGTRIVLPDWQAPDASKELAARGHFLMLDQDGARLIPPSC